MDRLQGRLEMIKDCLEDLEGDSEKLNWRPAPGYPSIYSLGAFVALNTDYWIGHALGELRIPTGLESVLEQAQGEDPGPLFDRLEKALETTRLVLEKLDPQALDKTINLNDEPLTGRQCILQALEDAAERHGQILTLMEWWVIEQP